MLGWITSIKGAINNAATYDLLVANIENMEREKDLLNTNIALLKSQAEILSGSLSRAESELDDMRRRLAAAEAEIARLAEENAHYRESEEFKELQGIAFKRVLEGGFESSPRCPQCHSYLSANEKSEWRSALICQKCKYAPDPRILHTDVYRKISKI